MLRTRPAPRRRGEAPRRREAWLLAAALASAVAASPVEAEVHGRLRPSLRLGGGWGSDAFLGAGLGPSAQAQLVSALALEASLTSRIKPFGEYNLALGLHEGTQGGSVDQSLALGSRIRLGGGLWAELAVEGQLQALSVAQAAEEALGLKASRTRGLTATPGARLWAGDWLFEVFGLLAARRLVLETGEPIDDFSAAASATARRRFEAATVALSARAARELSGAPSFSYTSAGAQLALAAAPLARLAVRLSASFHRNWYVLGRADTLVRASVTPTLWMTEAFGLEASYGYAKNFSSSAELTASRHYVYLGARLEADVWRR